MRTNENGGLNLNTWCKSSVYGINKLASDIFRKIRPKVFSKDLLKEIPERILPKGLLNVFSQNVLLKKNPNQFV